MEKKDVKKLYKIAKEMGIKITKKRHGKTSYIKKETIVKNCVMQNIQINLFELLRNLAFGLYIELNFTGIGCKLFFPRTSIVFGFFPIAIFVGDTKSL